MLQNKHFLFSMSFVSILALYCPDAFSKPNKRSVIPRVATPMRSNDSLVSAHSNTNMLSVANATPAVSSLVNTARTLPVAVHCDAGKYLPSNATSCSACKERYYCPGGAFWVKSGDQGLKYCPSNKIPNSTQTACVKASTKTATCKAGQYLPANASSCSSCRDRFYCPGGTFTVSSSNQGLKLCINSTPNAARSACVITCRAGQYLPANASSCSSCRDRYYCPGGTFITGTNSYNQGLKSCLFNTVPNESQTSCVTPTAPTYTCNAGQYLPSNATSCSNCKDRYYVCAGGTFNKSPITQGLLRCATGQIADSSQTQCIYETFNCSAGQYLPAKNMRCLPCKKDYYCSGGSYTYASIDQGADQCPAGFHPNQSQTECEKDLPNEVTCSAGFYLPANTTTMECKRCTNSKRYCPGGKTFKKSDIDQGIFDCPLTSVANDDRTACVLTLSKTFLQYGPNESAPLADQCWANKDSAKYQLCLFGNKVVLPEVIEDPDAE